MARLYQALRTLDPYHVTFGAVDAHAQDLWCFNDGTGALSLDVSLAENYANGLSIHADAHDRSMRRWPMDTGLIVNCLWVEGTWQDGIYTPRQLNSATWTGAITASLYHNLYFAVYEGTAHELVTAAMVTSRELHEIAPALLSSSYAAAGEPKLRPDIAVSVAAVPVPGMPVHWADGRQVPGSPPTGTEAGVVARAWSEAPAVGALEPYCIFLVAVNAGSHSTPAGGSGAAFGQLANYTLRNVNSFGMPYTHGACPGTSCEQFTASTPFQAAPSRAVPVLGSGDTRYIIDFIHAGETVVYQIGCNTIGPVLTYACRTAILVVAVAVVSDLPQGG